MQGDSELFSSSSTPWPFTKQNHEASGSDLTESWKVQATAWCTTNVICNTGTHSVVPANLQVAVLFRVSQNCRSTGQTTRESVVEHPKTLPLQERSEAGLHCESGKVPQFSVCATLVVVGRHRDGIVPIERCVRLNTFPNNCEPPRVLDKRVRADHHQAKSHDAVRPHGVHRVGVAVNELLDTTPSRGLMPG